MEGDCFLCILLYNSHILYNVYMSKMCCFKKQFYVKNKNLICPVHSKEEILVIFKSCGLESRLLSLSASPFILCLFNNVNKHLFNDEHWDSVGDKSSS